MSQIYETMELDEIEELDDLIHDVRIFFTLSRGYVG